MVAINDIMNNIIWINIGMLQNIDTYLQMNNIYIYYMYISGVYTSHSYNFDIHYD